MSPFRIVAIKWDPGWKQISKKCKLKAFLKQKHTIINDFFTSIKKYNGSSEARLNSAIKTATVDFVRDLKNPLQFSHFDKRYNNYRDLREKFLENCLINLTKDEEIAISIIICEILEILKEQKADIFYLKI